MIVTTSAPLGIGVGEKIQIQEPDKRRWKRAVCWLLRRPAPTRGVIYEVTNTVSSTQIAVERWGSGEH